MLGWEFPPFVSGGLGVHCYELTHQLAKMGHKVDFFMPGCGQELKSGNENIRLLAVERSYLNPYFSISKKGKIATYGKDLLNAVKAYGKAASKMVEKENVLKKYDVVHCHDWLTAKAGKFSAGAVGAPLVQTIHSTEYDRASSPWEVILGVEREAVKEADLIIAVSRRTAMRVKEMGADEKKIKIIYNAVDASKYAHKHGHEFSSSVREKKKVLFLGRLTEQKGPVQFLHAAKKVLDKKKDVIFFVAGTGEMLPLLINLSIELGIKDNVKFLGFLPDNDQKKIYSACDVYVMPSTSEPFGIVALEAMAAGTPVIISKSSGVSEVVKSALRVDFWDIDGMAQKILGVLVYPPLGRAMTEMEPNDLMHLTWEKTAKETLKAYNDALSLYSEKKNRK